MRATISVFQVASHTDYFNKVFTALSTLNSYAIGAILYPYVLQATMSTQPLACLLRSRRQTGYPGAAFRRPMI